MALKTLVERSIDELRRFSYQLGRALPSMESGDLSTRNSHGSTQYYRRIKGMKTGEYLSPERREEIRALELKNYYSLVKSAADEQIAGLERIKAEIEALPDTSAVYGSIPPEKRHLIGPVAPGMSRKQIEDWEGQFIGRSNTAGSEFVTKSGVKVRSKSELIIADRFEAYGVPYKYENELFMKGKNDWFPDFTVLNKRTGREYYWEHFGRMDDPKYCADTQYKIERYAKEGIIQGDNLIITSECSARPLSTLYVDILIKRFLL